MHRRRSGHAGMYSKPILVGLRKHNTCEESAQGMVYLAPNTDAIKGRNA